MNEFAALPLHVVDTTVWVAAEPQHTASLHDPAVSVLTDLSHGPRVTVHINDTADEALALMARAGVRLAFVDAPDGQILGLVLADALLGERPAQFAQGTGLRPGQVAVRSLMEPCERWSVVEYARLHDARIGHVVRTLQLTGRRHLIVVEKANDPTALSAHRLVVRGLFSATRIERAIGQTIGVQGGASTFAELGAELART